MRVKEIMTQPVVTCHASGTLNDAAQCMWEHDCGVVPVVDDEGRLSGVITDRDICMAAYTQGQGLDTLPVRDPMARHPLACHIDDSIETAIQLMREGQVRRIPVIDNDGRPVGIVSMNDLARHVADARKPSMDRELVEALAMISTPRSATSAGIPQPTRPSVLR